MFGVKIIKKEEIVRNGKIIGYQLYRKGILNALNFVGYEWLKRPIKQRKSNV